MRNVTADGVMAEMLDNKTRIEDRELALATCMAAQKRIRVELAVAKDRLQCTKSQPVVDANEARKYASDIDKLTRDLRSEEQYEKEKFEEIRILKLKHYDLQQQFIQLQTQQKVFKFPGAVQ